MTLEKIILIAIGVALAVGLGAILVQEVQEREEIIQNPTESVQGE